MKYLLLLAVLLSLLSISVDPNREVVTDIDKVDSCGNLVCYQPLSKYEQCLEDLRQRGELDDYHKAFCDPRFIPSDKQPPLELESF